MRTVSTSCGPAPFGRDRRLLDKPAFDRVFSVAAVRLRRHPYTLLAAPAVDADGPSRLGLVVGKKSARKAVDRNRIKRIARETFRREAAFEPALDVILLSRPGADRCDHAALAESLAWLWQRLRREAEVLERTRDGEA